jgi:glycine/D-amino acid oxidase-like deaminating enzyme
VWVPDAGVVLAEASLRAQQQVLADHGGTLVHGRVVVGLDQPGDTGTGRVTVHLDDGSRVDADVAVLAPGPWAGELLATAGIDVALQPYLEQVVHFGQASRRHAHDETPCFFDGPTDRGPGMYAMPTPGVGYKVGIDRPLRPWRSDDLDRTPDAGRTAMTAERVRRDLLAVPPEVLDAQVCSWTDSPDGRFVIDRVGPVVVACGDSGEGFKFSALMGEVLADVAEDREPLDDIETFSLYRFRNGERPTEWTPTTMGG